MVRATMDAARANDYTAEMDSWKSEALGIDMCSYSVDFQGYEPTEVAAAIRRVRETAVSCGDSTCGKDIPPNTTYVECDEASFCNDQCHDETHGKCPSGRYAEWEED